MKMYQIGDDRAYTEIDINSPEGMLIMNTCFENSDIKDDGCTTIDINDKTGEDTNEK